MVETAARLLHDRFIVGHERRDLAGQFGCARRLVGDFVEAARETAEVVHQRGSGGGRADGERRRFPVCGHDQDRGGARQVRRPFLQLGHPQFTVDERWGAMTDEQGGASLSQRLLDRSLQAAEPGVTPPLTDFIPHRRTQRSGLAVWTDHDDSKRGLFDHEQRRTPVARRPTAEGLAFARGSGTRLPAAARHPECSATPTSPTSSISSSPSCSEAPGCRLQLSALAEDANASLSRLSHVVTRLAKRGWVCREAIPHAEGRMPSSPTTATPRSSKPLPHMSTGTGDSRSVVSTTKRRSTLETIGTAR